MKRCTCSSQATIRTLWASGRHIAYHCSDACRERWIRTQFRSSQKHSSDVQQAVGIVSTIRDPNGFPDQEPQ